jgi:hypothetical protein
MPINIDPIPIQSSTAFPAEKVLYHPAQRTTRHSIEAMISQESAFSADRPGSPDDFVFWNPSWP